jgi:ribosomal protein S12 methylthiotransferase
MLLKAVNDAVEANAKRGWVRLMYAYPSNFTTPMIRALAELAHVVKYIDIPLQHASNRMLEAMRRNVTRERTTALLQELRDIVPGVAIRTTFITGFPGETEEDHQELLEFVEEIGFDAMGVFEYSREPGTRAGTMDADPALHVPAEIKARRKDELMSLQQQIAFEQAAFIAGHFDENDPANTGHQFDVLIDRPLASKGRATAGVEAVYGGAGQLYQGRCYFQAPDIDSVTYVQSGEALAPGELVRCTIVGSNSYDLVARPTNELTKKVSLRVVR